MAQFVAHLLIRFYQLTFSALVGGHCRYLPSCSDYADEAVTRHGLWPGSWMALARLCRCHPWGGSGYDPVPEVCPRGGRLRPWLYGRWSTPSRANDAQDRASNSAAKP